MSIIACRITEHGYEIAADTISVRHWTQRKDKFSKFAKLVEINETVIGGVGAAEEIALLQLFARTRKPAAATEHAILDFWEEFIKWKKEKTEKSVSENEYLLGFEGKVFHINDWFIQEILTFEAIGAGMDYALAAMYLGHDVEKAVEVAIELSVYCENPIIKIAKSKPKN